MDHEHKIRWQGFLESLTWAECLQEFLDALLHMERYRDAVSAPKCPAAFTLALTQMRELGDHLQSIMSDPVLFGQQATPQMADVILGMARRIRREVPTVAQPGNA